jgi:hypothetical protein
MQRNKVITISSTRIVTILIISLMLITSGFIIMPRIPNLFAKDTYRVFVGIVGRSGNCPANI